MHRFWLTNSGDGFAAGRTFYHGAMAYDLELAERIRDLLTGTVGLTEKKMFGGLAFLIGGNMAIAASSQGGLLVRVDPDESAAIVARSNAEVAVMRGRSMAGWLQVPAGSVTDAELGDWVELGAGYARSLPVKG